MEFLLRERRDRRRQDAARREVEDIDSKLLTFSVAVCEERQRVARVQAERAQLLPVAVSVAVALLPGFPSQVDPAYADGIGPQRSGDLEHGIPHVRAMGDQHIKVEAEDRDNAIAQGLLRLGPCGVDVAAVVSGATGADRPEAVPLGVRRRLLWGPVRAQSCFLVRVVRVEEHVTEDLDALEFREAFALLRVGIAVYADVVVIGHLDMAVRAQASIAAYALEGPQLFEIHVIEAVALPHDDDGLVTPRVVQFGGRMVMLSGIVFVPESPAPRTVVYGHQTTAAFTKAGM